MGYRHYAEEQENDKLKKELALNNGIKEENYIVIDCRKSELGWIKDNILNSELNNVFDLSNIDWLKCEEFALKNRVKEACNLKKEKYNLTAKEIGKIMKLDRKTIIRYLKKGTKLGWCDYDPKAEIRKSNSKNGKMSGKPVEVFKDDISLGIFSSCSEIERQSEELFGIKLLKDSMYLICNEKQKLSYKGFKFRYCN
jgi:transposase